MSRTQIAAKGTMVNIVQFVLQTGLQLILVPVILAVAGRETMGAYAAILQVIGYLALLDLGFTFTLNRYLPRAFGADDQGGQFAAVLGTGRTFLAGAGVAFAITAGALSSGIASFFSLSPSVGEEARLAVLLLAGWGLIRFPLSVYGSALIGLQDLAFRHLITAVGIAVRLTASLILLYLGFNLVGLAAANILGEAIDLMVCRFRFRRLCPAGTPLWGIKDRQLFKEMLIFSLQALLVTLAGRLILFTDKLVIGALMGTVAVSVFYITQMPSIIGYYLVWKLSDNAAPAFNEFYARKQYDRLRSAYLRLQRYTFVLAFPLFVGLILLNRDMVEIWTGPGNYAGMSVTFWLAAFAFLVSTSNVNFMFIMVTGRIRTYTFLRLVEGLASLGLAVALGKSLGLPGVAMAMFFSHLINCVYLQHRAQQELQLPFRVFFRQCLAPSAAITLGSGSLLLGACCVFPPKNLLMLMGVAGSFLLMHALLTFFFGLYPAERTVVRGWLHLERT